MTSAQLRALIPVNWRAALDGNLTQKELEQLGRALSDERRVVLPARDQWFRALDETPLSEVRAVILGQDPYPTQGQAEGLAFSVPDGVLPVPPSLRRILSEAAREATIAPGRTSLLQWARRGVLLLNAALTVPEGMAAGHATIGWQPVTDAILRVVASQPGWHPGRPPAHPVPVRSPDGAPRGVHRIEPIRVRERPAARPWTGAD